MTDSLSPVEEGKTYDLTIDAAGVRGEGIAHVDGFVVFVAGASRGERVRVKITAVKRTYAMGVRA